MFNVQLNWSKVTKLHEKEKKNKNWIDHSIGVCNGFGTFENGLHGERYFNAIAT